MQAPIKGEEEIESCSRLPVALKETIRGGELDFNLQRHLPTQEASGAGVYVGGEKEGGPKRRRHCREGAA